MAIHDPNESLVLVRDAIERLLRSRLCASTPAQMGYFAGLVGDRTWMEEYRAKVLERRQIAISRIQNINGLSVKPTGGAFYMFVRIDHPDYQDDKRFVLDLLHQEHVLLVHGSGFSPERGAGNVRIVHLADPDTLNEAFDRIDRFLNS